jgi:hypothetical protein
MIRFQVGWTVILWIPEAWTRFRYEGQVYRQRDGCIWREDEPRLAWLTDRDSRWAWSTPPVHGRFPAQTDARGTPSGDT